MPAKVNKTDEEWRQELSPEQYEILRQKGTERPWSHEYNDEKRTGTYRCAGCGAELFPSDTKFGEGHDLPARVLAEGIREERPDANVEIVDGVAAMGKILKVVLEDNSRWVFRPWMNWAFDLQYRLLQWRVTRWLAGALVYLLGSRGLLRMIERHRPDIVVS